MLFDQDKWILSKGNKVIKVITGVADLDTSSLTIYPNPASDFIEISNAGAVDEVEFVSASGIQVARKVSDTRISLDGLTPGFYSLVLIDREGMILGKGSVVVQE